MSSKNYIYYRFTCNKSYLKILIQETMLPVWEFKNLVIHENKMISNDFELLVYDEDNNIITDEYTSVHVNSKVIIKRIPSWMVKVQKETKEKVKEEKHTTKESHIRSQLEVDQAPTFSGYVCHRCGQKGHYIQKCPTNSDKNYDYIKLRKPTGIPKAFLQKIEEKQENEGLKGLLVTDKGLVRAQPQVSEWQNIKGVSTIQIPDEIKCKICNSMYQRPLKLNCGHSFCEDCISSYRRCYICDKTIVDSYYNKYLDLQIQTYMSKNA